MWNNATQIRRPLTWLTGLGLPVVFTHAGGPTSDVEDERCDTSFGSTKVRDAHRVPVWRASIERAWNPRRIQDSISCAVAMTCARACEERCEDASATIRPSISWSKSTDDVEAFARLVPGGNVWADRLIVTLGFVAAVVMVMRRFRQES